MEERQEEQFEVNPFEELVARAYANPTTRQYLKKIYEQFGYEFPEPETEKEIREAVKPYEEKLKAIETELQQKKRQELEANIKKLLGQYGLDESHLPAIQQFMMQNGIVNLESAIRFYVVSLSNARPNSAKPIYKQEQESIDRYKKQGKDALYQDVYKEFAKIFSY